MLSKKWLGSDTLRAMSEKYNALIDLLKGSDEVYQTTFARKLTKILPGNGLQGGGTLEGDRTLSVKPADDGIISGDSGIRLDLIQVLTSDSTTQAVSGRVAKTLNERIDANKGLININKADILLKRDKTDKNFGHDLELETLGHITRIAKGILEKDKQELYRYLPQEDKRYKIFDEGNCPISKQSIGWCKLANGLIMQWGILGVNLPAADTYGVLTVNFPVAFANGDYSVIAKGIVNAPDFGGEQYLVSQTVVNQNNVGSAIAFKVGIRCMDGNFGTGRALRWFAIGY